MTENLSKAITNRCYVKEPPSPNASRAKLVKIFFLAIVAVSATLCLSACGTSEEKRQAPAEQKEWGRAGEGRIPPRTNFYCTAERYPKYGFVAYWVEADPKEKNAQDRAIWLKDSLELCRATFQSAYKNHELSPPIEFVAVIIRGESGRKDFGVVFPVSDVLGREKDLGELAKTAVISWDVFVDAKNAWKDDTWPGRDTTIKFVDEHRRKNSK